MKLHYYRPIFFINLLFILIMGIPSRAAGTTSEPVLFYGQFVSLSESHILRYLPASGTEELVYVLRYPGKVESLLASPRKGLYYIFDQQTHFLDGDNFISQWSLPPTTDVEEIANRSSNPDAFAKLKWKLIVNDMVLSPDEAFLAYDMSSVDKAGLINDEFIFLYERATEEFRLIEIESRDLQSINSLGNLRWSPDGHILAYAYPTLNSLDTPLIKLVEGCTQDVTQECKITPLPLAQKMPFMRSFDWSPDGTRFAYSCNQDHLASHEICIINKDGSGLVEYPTLETYKFDMRWSPDGRMLAYTAYPPDNQEQDIYILKLENGEEINVSESPGVLDSVPFWWTTTN